MVTPRKQLYSKCYWMLGQINLVWFMCWQTLLHRWSSIGTVDNLIQSQCSGRTWLTEPSRPYFRHLHNRNSLLHLTFTLTTPFTSPLPLPCYFSFFFRFFFVVWVKFSNWRLMMWIQLESTYIIEYWYCLTKLLSVA